MSKQQHATRRMFLATRWGLQQPSKSFCYSNFQTKTRTRSLHCMPSSPRLPAAALWRLSSSTSGSPRLRNLAVSRLQPGIHHFPSQPVDTALDIAAAPTCRVSVNGSAVTIRLEGEQSKEETLFHAPWLWENDPFCIHPSSGQRTRSSLTSFYGGGWEITSATIAVWGPYDGDGCDESSAASNSMLVPVPTPLGCFHPTGSVYQVDSSDPDDKSNLRNKEQYRLLRVDWRGHDEVTGSEKTTTSWYELDWLMRCRYDKNARLQRQEKSAITREQAIGSGDDLLQVEYGCLVSDKDDSEPLYSFMSAIVEKGAALVCATPENQDDAVALVAKRLGGNLSHSDLYGDVFHVQWTPQANNIAYTSVALSPHQDLAYYESPPGLQLLHCAKNSAFGGESILVDALAAANEFRQLCPDLFEVLRSNEATFLKQRQGADMIYRRPHIKVDSQGQVVSVHWSPPFEGPLCITPDQVEDFYVARTAFERMLDNSLPMDRRFLPMLDRSVEEALKDYAHCYSWEKRLEPGEILVFNNQRMLHGRKAFSFNNDVGDGCGERLLLGCYTNMDDTMNRYRLMRRKRMASSSGNATPFIRKTGNGSSDVM